MYRPCDSTKNVKKHLVVNFKPIYENPPMIKKYISYMNQFHSVDIREYKSTLSNNVMAICQYDEEKEDVYIHNKVALYYVCVTYDLSFCKS